MMQLKLRSVGNSVGTTIPKSLLERMQVSEGDTLYVQENADGSFTLSAYDPDVVAQINAAQEVMNRDREIMKALV